MGVTFIRAKMAQKDNSFLIRYVFTGAATAPLILGLKYFKHRFGVHGR